MRTLRLGFGRYLENVPSIVPLLEKEYRIAAKRLEDTQEELNDLHPDKCARHLDDTALQPSCLLRSPHIRASCL